MSLEFKSGVPPFVDESLRLSPNKPTPVTTAWLLYTTPARILEILHVILKVIVFCPGIFDKVPPGVSKLKLPNVLPSYNAFWVIPGGAIKDVIEPLITFKTPLILLSVS